MIELRTIEGIIFLQYLTNYSIPEMITALKINDYNTFINEYAKFKAEKSEFLSIKQIGEAAAEVRSCLDKMKYYGITAIPFFSDEFPKSLRPIRNSPLILYTKGKLRSDNRNVAIVGSRKISRFADDTVRELVKIFVDYKFGIVSGLALGIDALAHNYAIKQKGYTIAVMSNSLDTIYPKQHYDLANRILDSGGALVSELPFGINRGRMSFIERNRIQSGLSEIVLPVEMGVNSGTMHTVNFSIEQKKKLFIPIPNNEQSGYLEYEGINHLISKQLNSPNQGINLFRSDVDLQKLIKELGNQTSLF